VALEQALGLGRAAGERARHVLIITDVQVSDEGRILRLAEAESRLADRRRISLLCLDVAPNSNLAQELADRGGGVARFLTSDPEQGDIATALDEVLADWSESVLAGLRLEVDRPGVEAAGHAVTARDRTGGSVVDLGDLPAGRPLWVVGRVPRGEDGPLSFRLVTGGGHELASCQIEPAGEAPEGRALTALFGARRVLALEHLIYAGYAEAELGAELRRLGHDPDRVLEGRPEAASKVYAENTQAAAQAALRELLVREALSCGLACSETAFVAVRSEAGRVVEGRVAVANALPAGWSEGFLTRSGYVGYAGTGLVLHCASPAMPAPADLDVDDEDPEDDLAAYDLADLDDEDIAIGLDASDAGQSTLASSRTGLVESKPIGSPDADRLRVVFVGSPAFEGDDALLFDSARDRGVLPEEVTLARLVVRFPEGTPDPRGLDSGLELRLFVDDPTTPRARVRLADLVRRRGERPLNLRMGPGQAVRIMLADLAGAWACGAPPIEVALGLWTTSAIRRRDHGRRQLDRLVGHSLIGRCSPGPVGVEWRGCGPRGSPVPGRPGAPSPTRSPAPSGGKTHVPRRGRADDLDL
jgi:Ca-activated chloride channel family protein